MRWLAFSLVVVAGCSSGETTSLDVRLLAQPDERQILAVIDNLELVFDSPDGFVGVGEAGTRFGQLQYANRDSDPDLEMVLRRELHDAQMLPTFRFHPGQNMARQFTIAVQGKVKAQTAAFGEAKTARFTSGETRELLIPFTLRDHFLPPRVKDITANADASYCDEDTGRCRPSGSCETCDLRYMTESPEACVSCYQANGCDCTPDRDCPDGYSCMNGQCEKA